MFLMLAKKHKRPNALNEVFTQRMKDIDIKDYQSLTETYLSVFFPSDIQQVGVLLKKYKGNEKELFSKLSDNFHACNPFDMPKAINYEQVLTNFLREHDPAKVGDVPSTLKQCKGKEAILFSVLAQRYGAPNALNSVLLSRLESVERPLDTLALAKMYLSVFNPSCVNRAKELLSQYNGRESDLFAKLAEKFRAINPIEHARIQSDVSRAASKASPCRERSARTNPVPQSPGIAV